MRKHLTVFMLLVVGAMWAGAPSGYYNDAEGKTGKALLLALHDIIDGHNDKGYDALKSGYYSTDKKPNGRVWDIYSDVPGGTPPYEFSFGNTCGTYQSEGDCYNREHTFPQSWFNKSSPMRNDIIHVLPTDGKVNGMRSNYPYGEVSNPSKTSLNGSKLGPNTTPGYSSTVFEPLDEYKGDLARIYFYMAARYNDKIAGWKNNGTADRVLAGNNFPVYDQWHIDLLLKWHKQDPVSEKETDRNDACHDYQGNRNPFVDHPEWVCAVWGGDDCTSGTGGGTGGGTEPVDSTADVTMTMNTADYQLIVDYVNTNLTNTDDHPDNTENYYGASTYHSNFDVRDGKYNSKFANADSAIVEALRDVYLPAKVTSSLLNVNYIVNYATYSGTSGSGTKKFHCSSTDPIAFTLGLSTVPVDTTVTDTTVVTPPDTTVVNPGDAATSLDLTFDTGLDGCTMVQVSGATGWSQAAYNDNGYAIINTYEQGANEAWLVTPAVNMDAIDNASFSFSMTSYNFGKKVGECGAGQFELYYASAFDGTSIKKSDWSRITSVDNVMLGDAKWNWVDADVDVKNITGTKVYYAFAHRCTNDGTTWEIDNVSLKGDVVDGILLATQEEIKLYPNPTSGVVSFSSKLDELEIISLSGRTMIKTLNVNLSQSVDVSVLESGIYIVKMKVGEESFTQKLIKE